MSYRTGWARKYNGKLDWQLHDDNLDNDPEWVPVVMVEVPESGKCSDCKLRADCELQVMSDSSHPDRVPGPDCPAGKVKS